MRPHLRLQMRTPVKAHLLAQMGMQMRTHLLPRLYTFDCGRELVLPLPLPHIYKHSIAGGN